MSARPRDWLVRYMRAHPERRAPVGRRMADYLVAHPERRPRGERIGTAKLTEDQVRAIRAAVVHGRPQVMVAADYGVSKCTISAIMRGRNWRHVDDAR